MISSVDRIWALLLRLFYGLPLEVTRRAGRFLLDKPAGNMTNERNVMDMADNSFQMKPGDVFVTLDDSELGTGKTPMKKELYLMTEAGRKDLQGSALLYAKGLRLSAALPRCEDIEQVFQPLELRGHELAEYRQANCVFRKNPDPDDNFYQVETDGAGTVWIKNSGQRSLRFQTADGLLYRVCAGSVQPLAPGNRLARIEPPRVLLDVDRDGEALDIRIRAVHILDGGSWHRGDVYLYCGDYTDSYHLRVQYQDDCLGVFEAYSKYFMGRPALDVLDVDSYGPAQWYVRNLGGEALKILWAGKNPSEAPADQRVYPLGNLAYPTYLEQEVPLP